MLGLQTTLALYAISRESLEAVVPSWLMLVLIEAVYQKAEAAGASRVYWLTQSSNAQARALYDKVADNLGFIQYRKVI